MVQDDRSTLKRSKKGQYNKDPVWLEVWEGDTSGDLKESTKVSYY